MINEKLNRLVGFAALVAIVFAVLWVLVVGEQPLTPVVEFKVRFTRVGQLRRGAAVMIANMEVGKVAGIRFAPTYKPRLSKAPEGSITENTGTSSDVAKKEQKTGATHYVKEDGGVGQVIVDLWIRKKYRKFVRLNSRFFVSSASLIGARHLEIAPPEELPGRAIRNGDTVTGEPPAHLDRMLMMAYENLKIATDLMKTIGPDLSAVRKKFGKFEEIMNEYADDGGALSRLFAKGRVLSKDLDELKDGVVRGTDDGKKLKELERDVKKFVRSHRERLKKLEEKGDFLAALFQERWKELKSMEPNRYVKEAEENLTRLFKVVRSIKRDLLVITQAVDLAEGTVGALMQDREIFDDFKESQKNIIHTPWRVLGRPKKMSVKDLPAP